MCVPKRDPKLYCDFGEIGTGCIRATKADCDEEATQNIRQKRFGGLSAGDIKALGILYPNAAPGKDKAMDDGDDHPPVDTNQPTDEDDNPHDIVTTHDAEIIRQKGYVNGRMRIQVREGDGNLLDGFFIRKDMRRRQLRGN